MRNPTTREAKNRLIGIGRFASPGHKRNVIQELFDLDHRATVPPQALKYIAKAHQRQGFNADLREALDAIYFHLQDVNDEDDNDPKESTSMNLTNAALLIRDDITTCKAVFSQAEDAHDNRQYTFIVHTSLNLQAGDLAVVHANDKFQVVRIVHIDDEPRLDPNDGTKYKWAIQKVDPEPMRAECQKTKVITDKLKEHQRRSVRDQVLAQFGVSSAQELLDGQ